MQHQQILFKSISNNVKDNQEYSYFKRHQRYTLSRQNRVKTPRYVNPNLVRFLPSAEQKVLLNAKPKGSISAGSEGEEDDENSDDCSEPEDDSNPTEQEQEVPPATSSISDDEEITADLMDELEMEEESDEES